ncbi:DnaJ family domain-containing protein [Microbacterium sp. NPDC055455]
MTEGPREAAERYRFEKWQREHGLLPDEAEATDATGQRSAATRAYSAADRAAVVETAIQQAIRRGEFDDLPGAGKPIPGLGESHDPDWWIRRKIETEKLTGLGPPALTLRVENVELDDRLDELAREQDVREAVEDFNRRVIEARRQLLGGPPVVTPTRDVEAEVAAWRERRDARLARSEGVADAAPVRRHPWWRRRGRE